MNDQELEDRLVDKIEVMNMAPPYKNEGMESLSRLGYLMAVNEIARWLVEAKLEENAGGGACA